MIKSTGSGLDAPASAHTPTHTDTHIHTHTDTQTHTHPHHTHTHTHTHAQMSRSSRALSGSKSGSSITSARASDMLNPTAFTQSSASSGSVSLSLLSALGRGSISADGIACTSPSESLSSRSNNSVQDESSGESLIKACRSNKLGTVKHLLHQHPSLISYVSAKGMCVVCLFACWFVVLVLFFLLGA
jgi:hypothetical protein